MTTSAAYELRAVARWRGYTWEVFDQLDTDEQAAYVAEYRTENRIQAVSLHDKRDKPDGSRGRGARSRRRR